MQTQEQPQPVQKPKYVSVLIREKDGHTYWAVVREDHRFFATEEESDRLAENLNKGLKYD